MPTRDEFLVAELQSTSENDWSVSQNKRFRARIIVWGMPKSLSTLEIRAKLADIGLASFARGSVAWEGDHVRLLLLPKDSKGLSKDVVGRISACLRKIGCRCVLDESQKAWESAGVQVVWFPAPSFVRMRVRGKEGSGKCLYTPQRGS